MNNFSKIIKAIPQTEKTVKESSKNKYVFIVSNDTNKIVFSDYIKKIYGLEIESINSINVKPKFRNVGKKVIFRRRSCIKMIVTFKEGQNFNFTSLKNQNKDVK